MRNTIILYTAMTKTNVKTLLMLYEHIRQNHRLFRMSSVAGLFVAFRGEAVAPHEYKTATTRRMCWLRWKIQKHRKG
uniref:Transcriptional regulator n=1 Tax=Panagrellus redivivus TaxID=6233 RepID=A0A7E4VQR5_PANRE